MKVGVLASSLVAAVLAIAALAAGCSSGAANSQASDAAVGTGEIADPSVFAPLRNIRAQRESDHFKPDFIFGPGDILEISVPDVEELKDRQVRVSSEGAIELPVVGTIQVAGLTESQFSAVLRQRLSKFVKDPEVDIFVKQYFSREVAVVGGVAKPGLYNLNSSSDTLLDMINQAGGLTGVAPGTIIFIPAPHGQGSSNIAQLLASSTTRVNDVKQTQASASGPKRALAVDAAAGPSRAQAAAAGAQAGGGMPLLPTSALQKDKPIVIDMAGPGGVAALAIPARPGDVLIVPAGGSVMVQGWVRTPGAYAISPGMTVLGAVTAAGGEMFSSSVTLLRARPGGRKAATSLDLAAIEGARGSDMAVQSGDVVLVNSSTTGAVPYFFYSLFKKFGTGISAAPPAF
jgi:protein involved in polysaccharide export with SLBB domain